MRLIIITFLFAAFGVNLSYSQTQDQSVAVLNVRSDELAAGNLNAGWLAWALVWLGALLIVPFARWSQAPPELRRLAIALIATYVPLQLVFGRIREVRLLLPLVLALIPLALVAVRDATRPPGATSGLIRS